VLELARIRVADFTDHMQPTRRIDAVKDGPIGNRIPECAVEGTSDALATGDQHLLGLGQFAGSKIMKPADLLMFLGKQ
jgi:predicted nucleic acid-binding protein